LHFGEIQHFFQVLTFAGHDSDEWFLLHNVEHHYQTNIPSKDPDIEHAPLIRHLSSESLDWYHCYQHYYSYLVYGIAGFRYYFFPFAIERKLHLFFLQIIFPIFFHSLSQVLLRTFIFLLVTSYLVALINIVNHTNDIVQFNPVCNNDFIEHQLKTSLNYGSESSFQNLLTSGLNNQIEHHLFPSMMSIAYPYIAPIVRDFALKHNLPYYEVGNFFEGLASHHRHLRIMGEQKQF